MARTTDTRQIRLLVDGILASHGIDDLQLAIELTSGLKRMVDSQTPVRTREEILQGLQKATVKGAARQAELDEMRAEIERRVRIRPNGRAWEDFLLWAWKQKEDNGQALSKFLDWYVSDEWRLIHPVTKPDSWYVQWPQAFVAVESAADLYETL